jgi:hypothetical protein
MGAWRANRSCPKAGRVLTVANTRNAIFLTIFITNLICPVVSVILVYGIKRCKGNKYCLKPA